MIHFNISYYGRVMDFTKTGKTLHHEMRCHNLIHFRYKRKTHKYRKNKRYARI